jgi:hypothetical protein
MQFNCCEPFAEMFTVIEPCIGQIITIMVDIIVFVVQSNHCEPLVEITTPIEPLIGQIVSFMVYEIAFIVQLNHHEPFLKITTPVEHFLRFFTCSQPLLHVVQQFGPFVVRLEHLVEIPPD